ncbi:MAG: hypothetical protein AAGB34_06555 [Planctomycetota bacterium]
MLTDRIKSGLNVALNEATLIGVEVSEAHQVAVITLDLLTLPDSECPTTEDARVSVVLRSVSRVAVSLRNGNWNDRAATPQPVTLASISGTVRSFRGQPIYGEEFFDQEEDFQKWSDRLSLDVFFRKESSANSITLFQEGAERHIDLRLWFDDLSIVTPQGQPLEPKHIIARAERWWKALYEGDPRTKSSGISPLKGGR